MLVGYFARAFPNWPLVALGLLPAILAAGLVFTPTLMPPLLVADGAIVLLATLDLFTLPRKKQLSVERQTLRTASLARPHPVTLTVTNHSRRRQQLAIRDGVPDRLEPTPDRFDVNLPARSRATVNYRLTSQRRGAYRLETTFVRVRSRWGLWRRQLEYAVPSVIHVYPDMQQVSQYAVLARTNRLSLLGVRRTRRIGQDNEFERLRDYTPDDNPRHIDWRSTARRRKLTVRDFQANQSQRVIFLLDCGRMMTNQAEGLSLLDHALNAMLMLGYVALNRGDSVGMIAFSDEIHTFVPPRGGRAQMNRLLHASFDRFPRLVESRYDKAFLYLAAQCRKRSLVILITNVIDEVNSNQIERYLGNLVGRHLPLGVLLRDHSVFSAVDVAGEPQGAELFRAGAAAELLLWRSQVLADLTGRGVLALDVFPEDLTAPLINRYLEIKARHLL
ncbi:MAG: DUF58 domain-containing protein [Pirellulales bacterium]|nr:DUF58 domain-containing protein [Pirellulales bacterium]